MHSIASRSDSMLKESLNNVPIFYNIKNRKWVSFYVSSKTISLLNLIFIAGTLGMAAKEVMRKALYTHMTNQVCIM
jgi:hypothetical protein